ncbi:MAG: hypothetical protein EBZ40_11675 [Gammaproteobacteria bacterium]|nr:hypothetical protein [Gammaproteobacteria bacterium]
MKPDTTQYRLGLVMFGLLPFLAGLKGLMIPANVTLLAPTAALAAFVAGRWQRVGTPNLADLALLALIGFMMLRLLASLNFVIGLPLDYGLHAISLLVVCPFMYYAGRTMALELSSEHAVRLLGINIFVVTFFLIAMVAAPDFVKRNGLAANSYYQYLGDGLAVAALTAWAFGYRSKFYWVYLLTALLLAASGSRASAVAYAIAMGFSNIRLLTIGAIVTAPLGYWLSSIIASGAGLDWAGQFRVLSTFVAYFAQDEEDASFSERQQFLDNAIDVITNQPIFGQVAYEVRLGEMGEYAHNILHLWANFGIIALILMLIVLFGMPLARLLGPSPRDDRYPLPLLVFVATELLFFRHPENIVLFFALGILASLYGRQARNA